MSDGEKNSELSHLHNLCEIATTNCSSKPSGTHSSTKEGNNSLDFGFMGFMVWPRQAPYERCYQGALRHYQISSYPDPPCLEIYVYYELVFMYLHSEN